MRETCVDLQSQGDYTLFRETISWTSLYDAHTEMPCLDAWSMTPELHRQLNMYYPFDDIQELRSMFEKQARVEKFDLIQSFHACKQEEGKPVADYVLKMKGYVEKLESLGYVLPQDVTIGLILNGLTKDFMGFIRNYNMHNMGKTIGEIHAMLIEYEKGLPKKAETPQVMMIKSGKIQKANKKSLKAKGRIKVKARERIRREFRIERNLKRWTLYLYVVNEFREQVEAIGRLFSRLVDDGFVQCFTDYGISISKNNVLYFNVIARNGIYEIDMHDLVPNLTPPYTPQHNGVSERRNRTLLDMVRSMMNLTTLPLSFWDYALESATRILNMVPTKKVDKTPYELCQEISGRAVDLEEIQEEEDTTPSEITSNIPQEVEGFEPPQPPQEEVIPIRRSERTRRAPNRLCLNVEVEEHSLGDLNEPTSYKAAMLDSESNKWIDAMNAEIQSMMDNMVWVLVDLPPGCKTVGSKWLFNKKTNMDGIVHVYKDRLVAKGYTQLYRVDYEETFSPVADIRAIRILRSIEQTMMFVDPKYPRKVMQATKDPFMVLSQASEAGKKDLNEEIKNFRIFSKSDDPFYKIIDERLIGIGQKDYMDKILKRYKMDNSKRGHIPMQERPDLNKSQGAQMPKEVNRIKNVPYASAVGCIMYAVRCTGPDVAFAIVFVPEWRPVDWKSSSKVLLGNGLLQNLNNIAASKLPWKLFG
ncbi:retrotransposon protein, putative, ty1-copia subclass [Tanacetum coccineum]